MKTTRFITVVESSRADSPALPRRNGWWSRLNVSLVWGLAMLVQGGCQPAGPNGTGADAAAGQYLATSEPEGALPVGQARQESRSGQALTIFGYIGGSKAPFVDSAAVFTIVDTSVPYCSEVEGCPTPWDYCCHQDDVKTNIATVKFVDGDGKLLTTDARRLFHLKELNLVVVQGVAERDNVGNLTLLAKQLFIKR